MEIKGRYRVGRDRETVLDALVDPKIVMAASPYLEEIEEIAPDEFSGVASIRFGLLPAFRLPGFARIEEIDPPREFAVWIGRRRGGGKAIRVTAVEDGPEATIVSYRVSTGPLGPFELFGAPWVSTTAEREGRRFFEAVGAAIGASVAPAAPDEGRMDEGDSNA